jgi:hypothetical protein
MQMQDTWDELCTNLIIQSNTFVAGFGILVDMRAHLPRFCAKVDLTVGDALGLIERTYAKGTADLEALLLAAVAMVAKCVDSRLLPAETLLEVVKVCS